MYSTCSSVYMVRFLWIVDFVHYRCMVNYMYMYLWDKILILTQKSSAPFLGRDLLAVCMWVVCVRACVHVCMHACNCVEKWL